MNGDGEVLNKALYRQLRHAFGEVRMKHAGEARIVVRNCDSSENDREIHPGEPSEPICSRASGRLAVIPEGSGRANHAIRSPCDAVVFACRWWPNPGMIRPSRTCTIII